jgi:hypothetical protein
VLSRSNTETYRLTKHFTTKNYSQFILKSHINTLGAAYWITLVHWQSDNCKTMNDNINRINFCIEQARFNKCGMVKLPKTDYTI